MIARLWAAGKAAAAALDGWRWTARSTVFGAFFAGTAFYLALEAKLTGSYVMAITAVHAFMTARSIAEDRRRKRNDDHDSNAG